MKLTVSTGIGLVATLLIAHLGVHAAEPEVNTSAVALDGLSSTKDHGVVKVMADPASTVPTKSVLLSDTRVPVRQYTLHALPPPAMTMSSSRGPGP